MKRALSLLAAGLFLAALSGCVETRSYTIMKERQDQSLAGNRGYIQGNVPAGVSTEKERRVYREHKVLEVEVFTPSEMKKAKAKRNIPAPVTAPSAVEPMPEDKSPAEGVFTERDIPRELEETEEITYDIYVVKKGDTLEKISKEVYGDLKQWKKIYDANKEQLKTPDRIYAGQKLKIPGK